MKKQRYINILLSFITTFALLFNYVAIYEKGIKSIKSILISSPIFSVIILIAITYFYCSFNKKEYKANWMQKIVSLFFAFVMLFGRSFEEINSWNLIFKNKLTLLVSFIGIIGYFILFKTIFNFLNYLITKIDLEKIKFIKSNKIIKIFEDKPFFVSLLLILIFWLIYLVAFYPGILTPDSSYQILQFFNVHTKYSDWIIQLDPNVNITNHHPVFHTILIGICVKLGKTILDYNFGIFIYTLLQTFILASTLAYTIKYLSKINISSKIRMFILGIYCLVPMFPFYAVTDVKDTIYTALIVLYIVKLFDYIKFYKNKKISLKQMIYWIVIIILISLFRNNGTYVIILSFIFAIFYSKTNIKRMGIVFLIYLILYKSYIGILLPYFKISDTSIREMLSVPFQQTARYVKYHEEDLMQDEKEKIDKVLGYADLSDRYKPKIADPVKNKYNKYATKEDLKEYFKVWTSGLFKHPGCYVQAFLNNTYGYFYPTNKGWYLYYNQKNIVNEKGNIEYGFNNSTENLRNALKLYGNGFRSIPLVGMISNIGFNTCVIIIYGVYLIMQKEKRKYLIVLLPHIITILFCLVSPVNNYFRYAMPYIFAIPITTVFLLKEITNKGEEKNGEK